MKGSFADRARLNLPDTLRFWQRVAPKFGAAPFNDDVTQADASEPDQEA